MSIGPALAPNQVLDRCVSTNDLARELGERGAPHGSWISARSQESGRGRLGRQWQSLEGNLFLSVIARIEDKSRWTWVPMATAVAVARVLDCRFPGVPVRIKWPNDLWVVDRGAAPGAPGAKLGGILCEAVGNRSGSFIVIGLGLNCLHAPEGLDQKTVSLSQAAGKRVVADDVRGDLVGGIVQAMDELASQGANTIVRDYESKAALPPGSRIEWSEPSAAARGALPSTAPQGVVVGLGPSGELIVRAEAGGELRLYAEDVRVRAVPRASGGSPA